MWGQAQGVQGVRGHTVVVTTHPQMLMQSLQQNPRDVDGWQAADGLQCKYGAGCRGCTKAHTFDNPIGCKHSSWTPCGRHQHGRKLMIGPQQVVRSAAVSVAPRTRSDCHIKQHACLLAGLSGQPM